MSNIAKIEFYAKYENTIFRNEKDSYTIFSVISNEKEVIEYEDRMGKIKCKGYIPSYTKGLPVKITGEVYKNKYNEWEIKVNKIKEEVNSREIAEEFLIRTCNGVGPSKARKIVDKLGINLFEYKVDDLKEIIKPELAIELINLLETTVIQREIFEYLAKYGCSYIDAIKLYKKYGPTAIFELKKDPYMTELPFLIKERIAYDLNIEYYDTKRVRGVVEELFNQNLGHTYLTTKQIIDYINFITKDSIYKIKLSSGLILNYINKSKNFIIEKGNPIRIFKKDIWLAEKNIAYNIHRLNRNKIIYNSDINLVKYVEQETNIQYDDRQSAAINGIVSSSGLKIMTGGPGTGKTTTINGIIKAYSLLFPENKIVLSAPTGRASQRMTETTGKESRTIHRTIEYKLNGDDVSYLNEDNPIDADFIIIDEASMIDTQIFSILLNAIKNNTLVLIVGDEDQLPSVNAGNILHDMIESQKIDIYRLKRVFRQDEDNSIITNCHKIKNNEFDFVVSEDFEIIKTNTENEMIENLKKQIDLYYDKDEPYKVQVLSPSMKNIAGTFSVNKIMQQLINGEEKRKITFGKTEFKMFDKIMLTRNNYDADNTYYNGDVGYISNIINGELVLNINNKEIVLTKENLEDLVLSYDITIHKSQGSEYPIVIILLPEFPSNMLQKKLLFTAISRASKKVILIEQNNSIEKTIKNTANNSKRNTTLSEKIKGIVADRIK